LAVSAQSSRTNPAYSYWISGNKGDKATTPEPGLALIGGGTDVDEAFRWLGAKAHGGDFLVLTASGNGIYNGYIAKLVPSLDSVATLQIPDSTAANDPFVAARIHEADAIFITGGDQSNYVNFWDDTPVEDEIYAAVARGVPLGGTSAGLAVLGDFDFSAKLDTITSAEALANPYDQRITLDGGFLTPVETPVSPLLYLTDTITDSHFQQRDRMGRLLTFMARLDADDRLAGHEAHGIGINEQTALLVEANGTARVVGNSYARNADLSQKRAVYFLSRRDNMSDPLPSPFDYEGVRVERAVYDPQTNVGDTFNLASWTGSGVDEYFVSVVDGVLSPTMAYWS
jgi:cyanophycinase